MVVDTGANVSIIRKNWLKTHKLVLSGRRLRSVTGDIIHVHGKDNITLNIDYHHLAYIAESLKAGILIASSVVDLSNSVIPVRIANISDRTRTIQEGEVIAACAPVTRVDRKCNTQDHSSKDLFKDLLQNTDLDEKHRCAVGG
ncbi:hypothetical protein TNCV_4187661 [Trichonephila clavipes]|nr:hypothetical protein TNCV_4187661 [Trichonephila clavipes]